MLISILFYQHYQHDYIIDLCWNEKFYPHYKDNYAQKLFLFYTTNFNKLLIYK